MTGHFGDVLTGQITQPTVTKHCMKKVGLMVPPGPLHHGVMSYGKLSTMATILYAVGQTLKTTPILRYLNPKPITNPNAKTNLDLNSKVWGLICHKRESIRGTNVRTRLVAIPIWTDKSVSVKTPARHAMLLCREKATHGGDDVKLHSSSSSCYARLISPCGACNRSSEKRYRPR